MVRRHVLAALAAGIAAGDDDVARQSLARIDWLVRRPARRILERALIDAALALAEHGAGETAATSDLVDAESHRHTMRVAALALRGRPAADPIDRARVASSYAAVEPPSPSRMPVVTISAALLVAAAAAGAATYVVTRPPRPVRAYTPARALPSATAFRDGGVPLRDPTVEALLTDPLIQLVITVDHPDDATSNADRLALDHTLFGAPALTTRAPGLATAWRGLIGVLDQWPQTPRDGARLRAASETLRTAARALSEQLAVAGLGYFVEGDVLTGGDHPQAIVHIYAVEQVVYVTTGGKPRRVLDLRRIDTLNASHSLLGMQSSELGGPVVLLESIDHHVATQVFPVLAPGAPFPLADASWAPMPAAHSLAAAAGNAVRADLTRALGADASAAADIATLLTERATLVQTWRDELERRHLVFVDTDDLYLPPTLLTWLTDHIAHNELKRALAIEDDLQDLDAARIAARLHDVDASTIRIHEAQHGLDDDRANPLPFPPVLVANIGPMYDDDGAPRDVAAHGRAELAAYLSEVANDPITPQLALWNLAGHAFMRPSWGTPESYAAVIVLDGIARHLGGASHADLIHDGEIDRDRLAAVAQPITAVSDDKLRAAAAALWLELYGEPLIPIVDKR